MQDQYGQSSTFATDLSINSLQGTWQGGMPFVTYQKTLNPDSGKLKGLDIRIELNGVDPSGVRNLQVIAPVSYQLTQLLKVDMTGLLHVNVDTPNGASKVIVQGDLNLKQDGPMAFDSVKRDIYLQNPVDYELVKATGLQELMDLYYSRAGKSSFMTHFVTETIDFKS